MEKYDIEVKVVEVLRTVFDPEIPVNIYDLGLIYKVDVTDQLAVNIEMTLTAPSCPAADFIVEQVRDGFSCIAGVTDVNVELVYEPEWNKDMMTEEAKLELGFM